MTTDHGPQRQPASVPQIEAQRKQISLREASIMAKQIMKDAEERRRLDLELDAKIAECLACIELHDEIASLRADVERLRRCLEVFANKRNWIPNREDGTTWWMWQLVDDPRKLADDALRGEGGESETP